MIIHTSTRQNLKDILTQGVQWNGYTQDNMQVILIQRLPFFLGYPCEEDRVLSYYQVIADIPENDVYIDIDDADAEYDKLLNKLDYLKIPMPKLHWKDFSGVGYGLFTYSISPEQIKSIELVLVDLSGIISTTQIYPLPGYFEKMPD